jgi:hypothetical protein
MVAARERHAILDARSCEFEDILQLLTTAPDTKPTCLYVRYSVAMGWKADFEQAASVIVLCARRGPSLRLPLSDAGAIRSLFQLMGRDTAYRQRRGRGVLVGEGRVAFVTASADTRLTVLPSLLSIADEVID